MTQEDKDLLLKYLCAALPYEVKVEITWWCMGEGTYIDTTLEPDHIKQILNDDSGDVEIKPYLRPMSSMTEDEAKELFEYAYCENFSEGWIKANDWLLAHHFDFRGFIQKGLAISTEEFNPYE